MIRGTVVADFFVDGRPAPQGSKGVSRSGRVYEMSKALAPWRKHITAIAREHYDGDLVSGPVLARLSFVMPRPVATPKTKPTPPAVKKPDCDKLSRAVLDALTKVVWVDDSQVVHLDATKRIAEIGEPPGVHISVVALAASAIADLDSRAA
ncbi:RusA family crossover junction endodeoxyribonuclease [Amycolatopsis sp. NPDC051373]|uniref:RusA family crossover junction endodeoxyribonuclease n=1 Tax=Amycolatopsis sp. NPDC051373 TaxID=3155801 RepID=UPI003450314E